MTEPAEKSDSTSSATGLRRLLRPRVIAFVVVLVLAIIFVVENQRKVHTHFIFFTVTTKAWVGFLLAFVLGAIVGQVGAVLWRRRRSERP